MSVDDMAAQVQSRVSRANPALPDCSLGNDYVT